MSATGTISVSSSIKFRLDDGLLPSFDNTLVSSEDFIGSANHRYNQIFYDDDTITIQAKLDDGDTAVLYSSEGCSGVWVSMGAGSKEGDYDDFDFYEWDIDFSTFSESCVCFKLDVESSAGIWLSEPCEILATKSDKILQIEWLNFANNYEVDYSTGISFIARIRGTLKDYESGGDVEVFDNEEEVTKVKDEVKRVLTLSIDQIPRYLSEILIVAMSQDAFYVNEVEFVAEDHAEVENSTSNLLTLKSNLTQRNVIGINTDDVGFDCESVVTSDGVITRQALAASGQGTFAVPEGYTIILFQLERASAGGTTPVIDAGTTVSGTDLLDQIPLNDALDILTVSDVLNPDISSAWTLYYEVTGSGATMDIYATFVRTKDL